MERPPSHESIPNGFRERETAVIQFIERLIDERDRFYLSQISSLKALIDERDRLYASQFKAAEVAVSAALAAQEKAVNNAFLASEKAVLKAEQAQKEYNERSNEFRGQLDDQAKTLMPRPETLSMFKSIEEKLVASQLSYDSKMTLMQNTSRNELDAFQHQYEEAHKSLVNQVVTLREAGSASGGRESGRHDYVLQSNWAIGIIVAVILALVQVALHFIK